MKRSRLQIQISRKADITRAGLLADQLHVPQSGTAGKHYSLPMFFALLGLCAISCLLPAASRAQDAKEIIQRAEDAIKGKTSSYSVMEMIIRTPDYTRTMTMESWTSGTSKALVKILSPVREAGNRTLKLGNDIWMYLRNTETTIRIPPSMMLQSWNGSDYTYDDMVREETLTKDYDITLVGSEKIAGADCWRLQLIPKPNAPVVWGKILYWVRKGDDLPAQVEYFDERGKLMRTMVMSDFRMMGGRTIPTVWTMYNSNRTHSTEIKMEKASFDRRIPSGIFSLRELER